MSRTSPGPASKTIAERLQILYAPPDAIAAESAIQALIAEFQTRIQAQPYELNSRDVILITYGCAWMRV